MIVMGIRVLVNHLFWHCVQQILRSVGEWSAGVPTEQSILHAYIDAIEKAEHFIYIEVQFVYIYVLVYILCLFVQVAGTAIS